MPCPRPKLEGALRGGEGQVQSGIDAAPSQWQRGYSRLGSGLGTVPAFSAHHYRRARASPSTAPGHARAATHARHAALAARCPTPVFEGGYNNGFGCGYDACDGGFLSYAGAWA